MRRMLLATAALAAIGLGAGSAQAVLLDPSTLQIGTGVGTSCDGSTSCYVYGNEVNGLGASVFDIYQNQGGNAQIGTSGVLVIFAVPNNPTNALSGDPITGVTQYDSLTGSPVGTPSFAIASGQYGVTGNSTTGLVGEMTSGDLYSFLGLNGATNSNSFVNLSAADQSVLGITANNFSVYAYVVNTSNLVGKGALDITTSGLPLGTFVVAYGEDSSHLYATPFTETGLFTSVPTPEPASTALLGVGLLGLGMVRRYRKG